MEGFILAHSSSTRSIMVGKAGPEEPRHLVTLYLQTADSWVTLYLQKQGDR